MSDPRLCHTTALRLGASTPDNKHGKDVKMTGDTDKLIPVKEEDHEVATGGATDYVLGGAGLTTAGRVTAVTWCDNVIQSDLNVSVPDSHTVTQLYMCPEPETVPARVGGVSPPTLRLTAGSEDNVPSTCCSVFSLSECVVSGGAVGVSPHCSAHSSSSSVTLPVPVSEVRLHSRTTLQQCTAQITTQLSKMISCDV